MKAQINESLNILLCFEVIKIENDKILYHFSLYAAENDHFPKYIQKSSGYYRNMAHFESHCLNFVLSFFGTTKENYKTIHWQN